MKDDIAPEAYADVVTMFYVAPRSTIPMSVAELHLFAYLGRILSLFEGSPISEWGYDFVVTSEGFPFSAKLDESLRAATRVGIVADDANGELVPDEAAIAAEYSVLSRISDAKRRSEWLRAATFCSLSIPSGSIRYAVNHSPGLAAATSSGQRRQLLQPTDVATLYSQYAVVQDALGELEHDLLAPAIVWLSAYVVSRGAENDALQSG
ncbi:hypothetical protein LCM19_13030 [Qipengyuania flava]|nr:hypothetical protein [Qipengyuania flava]